MTIQLKVLKAKYKPYLTGALKITPEINKQFKKDCVKYKLNNPNWRETKNFI